MSIKNDDIMQEIYDFLKELAYSGDRAIPAWIKDSAKAILININNNIS